MTVLICWSIVESPKWLHLTSCTKILGGGKDLRIVLCHSMNAGSVVGTLKPYLLYLKWLAL